MNGRALVLVVLILSCLFETGVTLCPVSGQQITVFKKKTTDVAGQTAGDLPKPRQKTQAAPNNQRTNSGVTVSLIICWVLCLTALLVWCYKKYDPPVPPDSMWLTRIYKC